MNLIVGYLSDYDNDAENICNIVIPDLDIFELDIKNELAENDDLTIQQVDSMRVLLRQVIGIRHLMDCMAFCSDAPTISINELQEVSQILGFQHKKVFSANCSETIEISKKKYIYYFITNNSATKRNIRYSYTVSNEAKTGIKSVPSQETAPIFGIFNEFYTSWITMKSATCN